MILNPNINVDIISSIHSDIFVPEQGYALWRDDEEGNLDENNQPQCYWLMMRVPKKISEARAPHIWAKQIDDTMDIDGIPSNLSNSNISIIKEKAAAYDIIMGVNE